MHIEPCGKVEWAARCENCKHWLVHHTQALDKHPCYQLTATHMIMVEAGLPAIAYTDPNFGCTLFERKGGE